MYVSLFVVSSLFVVVSVVVPYFCVNVLRWAGLSACIS